MRIAAIPAFDFKFGCSNRDAPLQSLWAREFFGLRAMTDLISSCAENLTEALKGTPLISSSAIAAFLVLGKNIIRRDD